LAVQFAAPTPEFVFAGQPVHCCAPPTSGLEYVPAVQFEHAVKPPAPANSPAGQNLQELSEVRLAAELKDPAAHGWQYVLLVLLQDDATYCPGMHPTHAWYEAAPPTQK
jgi:hypothetical protein